MDRNDRIEATLLTEPGGAMFVTELVARVDLGAVAVEEALAQMQGSRTLLVDHRSPDRHLDSDFRVVALVDPERAATEPCGVARRNAAAAAADVWSRWLRDALAAHRCG